MWYDFLIQFISNLASGVVIAAIFFLLSDYIFRVPILNGSWTFTTQTEKTSYNNYKAMLLTYTVLLWQNGKTISGSGEKISENANGNIRNYTGSNRSQIKISGYITKNYLTKDRIIIHYEESSESRISSTIHLLTLEKDQLSGNFISTIAESEGKVTWTKNIHDV